jgi:type I restriction enzyme M protein
VLNNPNIKALIDKLWNNFWSGGIANPLTAIEQITYLIFMRRLDDIELKRERDAEFLGETYKSRFSGTYKAPGSDKPVDRDTLRWSRFQHMKAEDMLLHVQTKVFPFLKEIDGGDAFSKSMDNAVFIMPKPSLLVEAVKTIDKIFVEIEKDANEGGQSFQDIQGDVYEMLLSEIAAAGKNGQFRTPRHIIKLMAELTEPQIGHRIADPACGTGGFLLGAYQYMLTQLVMKEDPDKVWADEDGFMRATITAILNDRLKNIVDSSLYGFDIDTTMVRLGLMNLMMHGIETPHIRYTDTLSKAYNEETQYNIILANPPFTGNIDKGDINESFKLGTTKTELLFIERIYNMLVTGGTAAVVVPQGVLFGSGKAFVAARKIMVEQSELKAVIAMPSGVFKPYAGVATAILVFTKGGETKDVWFYDMKADGYTLDDKRTRTGQSDLQDIVKRYKARKKDAGVRTGQYFSVTKKEIADNDYDLSLNKYKEEVYEEVKYEKPDVIFWRLESIEQEIISGIKSLKQLIK